MGVPVDYVDVSRPTGSVGLFITPIRVTLEEGVKFSRILSAKMNVRYR